MWQCNTIVQHNDMTNADVTLNVVYAKEFLACVFLYHLRKTSYLRFFLIFFW